MSVYPQFIEYIQQEGLYVPGYNYEEMYNIMVDALTNDKDSSNNFIYTQQQVNNLYEVLDELLYPLQMETDIEPETETNEPPILPNVYTNQTNQTALQAFNNYIITALNNSNQINQNNLYNLNYNNVIYYNNT
uniref:Uncharacterized protein n=1 Tax=viral metagenome TaxID=1070528 RepID=A0A6C0D179_9ZZZZ